MIQDIYPKKFDNQYSDSEPVEKDKVLIFRKRELFMRCIENEPDSYELPDVAFFKGNPHLKHKFLRFAFAIDDVKYFLCFESDCSAPDFSDLPEENGFSFVNLNFFRFSDQKELCFAAVTGHHIYRWYISNLFCGKCGSRLKPDPSSTALNCPECNNRLHPVINPAVIIAVRKENLLLMAKHTKNPDFPHALIAGFCETGESAEQTVYREVMEEVGIPVKNIRYYGSQPWGVAGNLSIGFVCEPADKNAELKPDKKEISHAAWFGRDEIDYDLGTASLTGTMILDFINGKL